MLRKCKIVCTVGRIPENQLQERLEQFLEKGMDVARINMAHFDVAKPADREYVEKLIETIRKTADGDGAKAVAIMGDIQGPKVRIKTFAGEWHGSERVSVEKDDEFVLTSEDQLPEGKSGATVKYEGSYDLFENIKCNVKKDDRDEPLTIEFWFADGQVILTAQAAAVTANSITCRVIVDGELKKGQGISVKNSATRPGPYNLANYPKDRLDIDFLLQMRVDMLALSFVKTRDDVRALQDYVDVRLQQLKLPPVSKRFLGIERFPVVAKIETEAGWRGIDEILEVSYAIMVARGDLALRTGIQTIGILQKEIIGKSVTKGKPVITATQMLLSMMDFKEPKRSEATDVTNAVLDGTDALMLSEETGDPDSKFPVDSVAMMANIVEAIEWDMRRRSNTVYRQGAQQCLERASDILRAKERTLDDGYNRGTVAPEEYKTSKYELSKKDITDQVSCNACITARELGASAIICLTETGGTARMLSRFRPDAPVFAGVYDEQVARLLKLSFGVEAFRIERNEADYPFGEYEQVLSRAKSMGYVKRGDRVVLVAGYPRRELGRVTFINVYPIE